jgi:hypothetical protein
MTSRDPDAVIRTWLSEGAEDRSVRLPDRVVEAIAADIHLTRRRAGSGPWRFLSMSRIAIASVAAVVAVVVAGAALIGLFRPAASVGGTVPVPSLAAAASSPPASAPAASQPASTGQPSAAASTADLAVGSPFGNVINAGSTYHSVGFTSPLAFTMPSYASSTNGTFNAETWTDHHTLRIHWANDHAVTIHDGLPVSDDVCHPTALVVPPASPAAVESWLRGASGVTVTNRPDIALAGGAVAKVFDVSLASSCYDSAQPPPGNPQTWFAAGEQHRIYAIQRGDRTVLVVTWMPVEDASATNTATDQLVASLQFP